MSFLFFSSLSSLNRRKEECIGFFFVIHPLPSFFILTSTVVEFSSLAAPATKTVPVVEFPCARPVLACS